MLGRWWVLPLFVVVLILLLWGPRLLPKLGSRLGRGARDLTDASREAGKNLREEASRPADPNTDPPPSTVPPPGKE